MQLPLAKRPCQAMSLPAFQLSAQDRISIRPNTAVNTESGKQNQLSRVQCSSACIDRVEPQFLGSAAAELGKP